MRGETSKCLSWLEQCCQGCRRGPYTVVMEPSENTASQQPHCPRLARLEQGAGMTIAMSPSSHPQDLPAGGLSATAQLLSSPSVELHQNRCWLDPSDCGPNLLNARLAHECRPGRPAMSPSECQLGATLEARKRCINPKLDGSQKGASAAWQQQCLLALQLRCGGFSGTT